MTKKELKKLNRYQLLELLVMQTERADKLQKQVDDLEKRLKDRDIKLSKLGSVAEASIQISGVFEAAQQAADLYLEAAKKRARALLVQAQRRADSIIAETEKKADEK